MPLYTQRMQRAIDLVGMYLDDVSVDAIAIIGYFFGGTGVVQYGFSGATDAKLAVAFLGGLQTLPTYLNSTADEQRRQVHPSHCASFTFSLMHFVGRCR
jgi:dienelactone hydrolase